MTYSSPLPARRSPAKEGLPAVAPREGGSVLTPRQLQVARLACEDLPNKEIADRLAITLKTVQRHRQEINWRLGVHSPIGLLKYMLAQGWYIIGPSGSDKPVRLGLD